MLPTVHGAPGDFGPLHPAPARTYVDGLSGRTVHTHHTVLTGPPARRAARAGHPESGQSTQSIL
jgi:hypothetical protein